MVRRGRRGIEFIGICVAIVFAWGMAQAAEGGVGGRVVLDANRNGRAEPGEPGVAGVAVSDGVQVVVTDAAGAYRLARRPEATTPIWICVPRDHAVSGSFWKAAGTEGDVDFGLTPQAQDEAFTFIHFTDTHIGRGDLLKRFAEQTGTYPVRIAFAVNTGDLVGGVDFVPPEKAPAQYERYMEAARFPMPLFNLPGNHEHVGINYKGADREHPFYGKGLYPRLLGPMHYSWDWAGVHCVALDGAAVSGAVGKQSTGLAGGGFGASARGKTGIAVLPPVDPFPAGCNAAGGMPQGAQCARCVLRPSPPDLHRDVCGFSGVSQRSVERRMVGRSEHRRDAAGVSAGTVPGRQGEDGLHELGGRVSGFHCGAAGRHGADRSG